MSETAVLFVAGSVVSIILGLIGLVYKQTNEKIDRHLAICEQTPNATILAEIHHLGDSLEEKHAVNVTSLHEIKSDLKELQEKFVASDIRLHEYGVRIGSLEEHVTLLRERWHDQAAPAIRQIGAIKEDIERIEKGQKGELDDRMD